jgi:hypothetical protein
MASRREKSAEANRAPEPTCRCGRQPNFAAHVFDPQTGKAYRIFQCDCGAQIWSE